LVLLSLGSYSFAVAWMVAQLKDPISTVTQTSTFDTNALPDKRRWMKPVLSVLRSESGRAVRSGGDPAGQAVNPPLNVTLESALV